MDCIGAVWITSWSCLNLGAVFPGNLCLITFLAPCKQVANLRGTLQVSSGKERWYSDLVASNRAFSSSSGLRPNCLMLHQCKSEKHLAAPCHVDKRYRGDPTFWLDKLLRQHWWLTAFSVELAGLTTESWWYMEWTGDLDQPGLLHLSFLSLWTKSCACLLENATYNGLGIIGSEESRTLQREAMRERGSESPDWCLANGFFRNKTSVWSCPRWWLQSNATGKRAIVEDAVAPKLKHPAEAMCHSAQHIDQFLDHVATSCGTCVLFRWVTSIQRTQINMILQKHSFRTSFASICSETCSSIFEHCLRPRMLVASSVWQSSKGAPWATFCTDLLTTKCNRLFGGLVSSCSFSVRLPATLCPMSAWFGLSRCSTHPCWLSYISPFLISSTGINSMPDPSCCI